MNISRDRFLKALKKKPFILRECSICDYPLSLYVQDGQLLYDSGCDCVNEYRSTVIQEISLDFYLNPANAVHERIKKFVLDHEAIEVAAKEFTHE